MNAEWAFLEHLFDIGWQTTDRWLAENFEHLGRRSTFNARAQYQGEEQALPDPKMASVQACIANRERLSTRPSERREREPGPMAGSDATSNHGPRIALAPARLSGVTGWKAST